MSVYESTFIRAKGSSPVHYAVAGLCAVIGAFAILRVRGADDADIDESPPTFLFEPANKT